MGKALNFNIVRSAATSIFSVQTQKYVQNRHDVSENVELFGRVMFLTRVIAAQSQKTVKFWVRYQKTSQELRMLSSVTINCQFKKIVMNSGSQLSEL